MKWLLSVESGATGPGESGAAVAAKPRRTRGWNHGRRSAGFTLIEMMIVVAIIAVLTAIAYPAYTSYITKTHRVAAEGCLSESANFMERYYTTNLTYKAAVLPQFDCRSTQQTGANYTYDLPAGNLSVSAYIVEAVPINAQLTRDAKCGTLQLDQTGKRTAVNDPTGVAKCW